MLSKVGWIDQLWAWLSAVSTGPPLCFEVHQRVAKPCCGLYGNQSGHTEC